MKTGMARESRSITGLALLAVMALVLTACSSGLVRGEPPYVKIDSLRLDGTSMEIGLGVRNINEVTIDVARIGFTVMLDGSELARFDEALDVSVTASGRETLRFELPASEPGRQTAIAMVARSKTWTGDEDIRRKLCRPSVAMP